MIQLTHKQLTIAIAAVVIAVFAFAQIEKEAAGDRATLTATLKQQGDVIGSLEKRISDRDQAAAAERQAVDRDVARASTPAEQAALISQLAGLRTPIVISTPASAAGRMAENGDKNRATFGLERAPASSSTSSTSQNAGDQAPDAPNAIIPASALPDLLQHEASCRKCSIDLSQAQGDNADLRGKVKATEKERDAAVNNAHGGSLWQRTKRAGKWFAIGAGAGAVTVEILRRRKP